MAVMKLRKVALGLATITLLASCGAKQITKAEAIKVAQDNYDSSNQVYKAVHIKMVTEVTYSDNVPEELRDRKGESQEADFTGAQIAKLRVTSDAIERMDEEATTFKIDGKKLEITLTETDSSKLGSTTMSVHSLRCDEIGYVAGENSSVKTSMIVSSGVIYDIIETSVTYFTWTK